MMSRLILLAMTDFSVITEIVFREVVYSRVTTGLDIFTDLLGRCPRESSVLVFH